MSSEVNEQKKCLKVPKGTRDYDHQKCALYQEIIKECENILIFYNAVRIDTPTFEVYDYMMDKYGENSKEVYVLENPKELGEKCALRYDLTVPFSRFVKMRKITTMKRYQIGKVFRRDQPSQGRYREFTQCDFDLLGNNDTYIADVETLTILDNIFKALCRRFALPEFTIRINSRNVLMDMMTLCGVKEEYFVSVCRLVDKLDKYPFAYIVPELEKLGIEKTSIDMLHDILVGKTETHVPTESLNYVKKLVALFPRLKFDPTLARGLDYYTGIIFEVGFNGCALSVAGGGRYDNLCENPCVGFSVGIDRLLDFICAIGTHNDILTYPHVWVVEINKNGNPLITEYRMKILYTLREKGIRAETEFKSKPTHIKEQLNYALSCAIPFVVIVGENEMKCQQVTVKNMAERKQFLADIDCLEVFFK